MSLDSAYSIEYWLKSSKEDKKGKKRKIKKKQKVSLQAVVEADVIAYDEAFAKAEAKVEVDELASAVNEKMDLSTKNMQEYRDQKLKMAMEKYNLAIMPAIMEDIPIYQKEPVLTAICLKFIIEDKEKFKQHRSKHNY